MGCKVPTTAFPTPGPERMLSISSGSTLITAYRLVDVPPGVGCESGVKLGNGTGITVSPAIGVSSVGSGEPMNKVGVSVAEGG